MTSLTKTSEKPTKGDKAIGLFVWGALLLLSIYLVYATDWVVTGLLLGSLSLFVFVALIKELRIMLQSSTNQHTLINNNFHELSGLPETLYFKDNEAAFEYSKQFLKRESDWSVGIVLGPPKKNDSGRNEYHVKILNHKSEIVKVTALQLERIKKSLIVGDFVAVITIPYKDVPANMNIKKVADVVLFVHSKLKPEYSMQESAWVVDAS